MVPFFEMAHLTWSPEFLMTLQQEKDFQRAARNMAEGVVRLSGDSGKAITLFIDVKGSPTTTQYVGPDCLQRALWYLQACAEPAAK